MSMMSAASVLGLMAFVVHSSAGGEPKPQSTAFGLLGEARGKAGGLLFWSEAVSPKGRQFAFDDPYFVRPFGGPYFTWPPEYADALERYESIMVRFPEANLPPQYISRGGEPIFSPHLQAYGFYRRYFPRYPDLVSDVALVEAAICQKKLGRLEEAEKRLASVAEKYKGLHYEPQDALARTKIAADFTFIRPEEFARYELALMRAEQERFEEAEAGFEEVIRRYPNCRLAYLAFDQLASIFEKQGRLEDAADVLERKWGHIEEHWPVYMGGVCSLSNEEKQKIRSGLMRRVQELRRRAGEREETGR